MSLVVIAVSLIPTAVGILVGWWWLHRSPRRWEWWARRARSDAEREFYLREARAAAERRYYSFGGDRG